MFQSFDQLLHQRILTHCEKLIDHAHYKAAAREAMVQVELAMKEKAGVKDKYGVTLIKVLFGPGKGIKLRVPFGEDAQKHAESLFTGAFSYYRNYAAHDGRHIDRTVCLRILVIASELLDLIGASNLSFADVGGISGLIESGAFENEQQIHDLLAFLDNNILPDHVCDSFYEDFAFGGFSESQLQATFDLGFVEYRISPYILSQPQEVLDPTTPEEIGVFELTVLGSSIRKDLEQALDRRK